MEGNGHYGNAHRDQQLPQVVSPTSPPQFSTLEVAPNESGPHVKLAPEVYSTYDSAPEPIPYQQQTQHEQSHLMHQYYGANQQQQHGSPQFAVSTPNSGFTAPYQHPQSMGGEPSTTPESPASGDPKRTVVMKRKTLWILAVVVAVLIIGAIVGGAVGGTLAARNNSQSGGGDSSSPSPSPSPTTTAIPDSGSGGGSGSGNVTTVLTSSALSAVNYTVGGTDYRMLLWQPGANQTEIVYSLWDSSSNAWEVVRLQSRLSGSANIEAKPGTPIAGTVRPGGDGFQLNVFYLSASNVIQELKTTDAKGASWDKTTHSVSTANGSQLAARWDVCGGGICSGAIAIIYEDDLQRQNWYWPGVTTTTNQTARWTRDIVTGSGLALSAIPSSARSYEQNSLKVYYQQASNMVEISRNADFGWVITNTALARNLPQSPPPKTHAVSFSKGDDPPLYIALLQRYNDGSLQLMHWNNQTWRSLTEPVFRSVPSGTTVGKNFSAVSITPDMRVYAVASTGDVLHTFNVDRDDPVTWTYDGQVKLK